jgi:hypothetical protein
MSQYIIQKETLVDIVSAIREKDNNVGEIKISEIANKIRNLKTDKNLPFVVMVGTSMTDLIPVPLLTKKDITWAEWCNDEDLNLLHSNLAKTGTEDIISTSTNSVIYNRFGVSAGSITHKDVAVKPEDKINSKVIYYCILNTGIV